MNRSCSKVAGTLPVGMVLAISGYGQSLVEPERVPEVRQIFEAVASAPQLRCEVTQVRPWLNFDFSFRAGYTAEIPLGQFRGSGHDVTVYARVTPEGGEPVYMTKTEALPEVPETKADAVTAGAFVLGEGTYGLAVLVEDDLHRNCRGSWQVQARRWGSERQLSQMTPPGVVEELSGGGPQPVDAKHGPRIGRLTILVHAAPISPNLSSLQPYDVQRLVDSLSSLLRELPAQSVRLIAFNLAGCGKTMNRTASLPEIGRAILLVTLTFASSLAFSQTEGNELHHHNLVLGLGPATPLGSANSYLSTAPFIRFGTFGYGYRLNRLFQANTGIQMAFALPTIRTRTDIGNVQGGDHEFTIPVGGRVYIPQPIHRIEASAGGGAAYLHYSDTATSDGGDFPVNCYSCTTRGGRWLWSG